ncbi:MAG: lysophospholipid acyltransferase family protein, partial [bacterium]|nr:lysophospholipid acyltransferase family protein [bacterium]
MIYWISVFILKLFAKCYFRGKAYGLENFPQTGPYIGVVNHKSNMDVIAMALAVRHKVHTMVKHSLFRVPVLKWWLRAVGMFPVIRNAADRRAFNHAVDLLRNQQVLFMAPEGTRKKKGSVTIRPKTGFVRLAQITDVPVVPIAIFGTDDVL